MLRVQPALFNDNLSTNISLIFAIDAPVCAITDLVGNSGSLSSPIVFAR